MLTVVMPTFNHELFVRDAIDSILSQTYPNWELIIVDDASTDSTPSILQSYILKDRRIRVVVQLVNGGTGKALNTGFGLSNGALETWWASDNILYPTAFEEMVQYLTLNPKCDHVYCNNEIGVMDHTGEGELFRRNLWEEVDQTWSLPTLFNNGYFLGCVWMWKRKLRETVGPFQEEPCEDYDFVLRAVEAGFTFEHLNRCLGWQRRWAGNITNTKAKPMNATKLVLDKSKHRRGLE